MWFVDVERLAVSVTRARPRKPSATWTCSLRRRSTTRGAVRRAAPPGGRSTGPTRREALLHLGHDLVVIAGAGDRHDHRRRSVPAAEEVADVVGRDGLHRSARPRRLPAERVVREQGFGQQAVRDVLREVVVHRQLLQDDLALVVDVAVAQCRHGQHVTEELDGQRQVLRRHPAVVRRVLLGREGVDVAAHPIDRGGDGPGAARLGALEQQVLEEVRHARQLVGLVPGPHPDPHPGRHRERRRDALGDDPQPRGELRDVGVGWRGPRDGSAMRGGDARAGGGGRHRADRTRGAPAGSGPRSPKTSRASASKASSKVTSEVSRAGRLGADDARRRPRSAGCAEGPLKRLVARGLDIGDLAVVADRAQADLAAVVDVVDADLDLVAEVDHVLDPVDPLAPAQLGDVDQAVAAREGC